MDEFALGFVSGGCAVGLVALIAFIVVRWLRGTSPDTLPAGDRASGSDPDLRPAVIEYALDEAAAQVVMYELTQNEHRAAMARLRLAVRARKGEMLSDLELGVLLGVIGPSTPPSLRKGCPATSLAR